VMTFKKYHCYSWIAFI